MEDCFKSQIGPLVEYRKNENKIIIIENYYIDHSYPLTFLNLFNPH